MKLTWFGGTTMRIHIGGKMLVIDAEGAPVGIDRTELASGADIVLSLADLASIDVVEPTGWTPRKAGALIDEAELPDLQIFRLGTSLVVDALGERPLLLVTGEIEPMGRWAGNAVVAVMGAPEALPDIAANVLELLAPKLIAVAGPEAAVDQAMLRLQSRLDETGFMALEAGLALEV